MLVFPADPQAVAVPDSAPHMLYVAIAAVLYAVAEFIKAQVGKKNSAKVHQATRQERNEELDHRITSLRQAINSATDSVRADVTTLSGEVKDLKSHVIGPDGQNGLRGDVRKLQVELAQLAPRKLKTSR